MARTIEGKPSELADWAYRELRRKDYEKSYALVLIGQNKVIFVESGSKQIRNVESNGWNRIVGYYTNFRNTSPIRINASDIQEAIEEALQ